MFAPITITIPGEIRGKGRPRFSTRNGVLRTFTDDLTANAEAWVKHCATQQAGQPCHEGPIHLDVLVYVEIPASWSKKKRADAVSGKLRPTGRPDFDNTIKMISDSLNKIIWKDDSQITDSTFAKWYAEAPSAQLRIVSAWRMP